MAFLDSMLQTKLRHGEELRRAWASLNYDVLTQQGILTPPSTPAGSSRRLLTSQSSYSPPPLLMLSAADQVPKRRALGVWKESELSGAYFTDRSIRCTSPEKDVANYTDQSLLLDSKYCRCCYQRTSSVHQQSETYTQVANGLDGSADLVRKPHASTYAMDSLLRPERVDTMMKSDIVYRYATRSESNLKRKAMQDKAANGRDNKRVLRSPLKEETPACQVQGILSRPGCRDPKYTVTAEELKRRVDQPECLTKVDMIAYVRLAKTSARVLLEKHGVKTNQHNQRSEHTILSKICEAEAKVLAEGIREMNCRHFPSGWLARRTLEDLVGAKERDYDPRETLLHKYKDNEVAKCALLDIYFGIEKRQGEAEMAAFERISHSFGIQNIQDHILFLLRYLDEEMHLIRESL